MAQLFAGTSGFAYDAWKPDFYPAEAKSKDYLRHYAARLNAVEINYTFRRLPSTTTLENWLQATPEGFVFAIKAHQRITHIQRLKKAEFTEIFFKAVDPLRVVKRLGPILVQLPPNMKYEEELLRSFLEDIPAGFRCAFEFRHASWLNESVYAMLEAKGMALCLAESDDFVVPEVITGGFVYCRLRKSEYLPEERVAIKEKVQGLVASGKDVYVFYKHEDSPAGALFAEELLR
jgi:uncharacterized protein YecE (DUF72 family)